MDASVLQAAQRVMAWHLQHTMLPVAQLADATDGDDTGASADTDSSDADAGAAVSHAR